MIRSYFDVEEVVLSEQHINVVFAAPLFAIGKDIVVRTTEGERVADVQQGTKASLPLWAATPLKQSGLVQLTTPPTEFSQNVFREFKIDPLAPDLKAKSPSYYEYGLAVAAMLPPHEAVRLKNQLNRLFQLRFYHILQATAKKGHDYQDLRETLPDTEGKLLDSICVHEHSEKLWAAVRRRQP